jgi:sialic acid synthase SpsE
MAQIEFRNGVKIGDYALPYIVAELNTSHFGSVEIAKEMVRSASDAGCNAVKFQSWSENSLYSEDYYRENPIAKRFVSKFSFSEAELQELSGFCSEVGISFASTPYSRREVDVLLDNFDAPYIKIASMDLNNLPFIEYIAKKNVPIVLSTGMSELKEIQDAVDLVLDSGSDNLCILHCVSSYPAQAEMLNLNNILMLREFFPTVPVGYSDHSLGIEMPSAATALGACLIEKHFTLDSSKIGMDNQMAIEADELAELGRNCRNVHIGLGSRDRRLGQDEKDQRTKMRRSLIVCGDLPEGHVLTDEDLDAKRPGSGLPPVELQNLVGRKLTKSVSANSVITEADIE